jgi:multidrug efflux pump subunit AcrA (membrane-fusion protein)
MLQASANNVAGEQLRSWISPALAWRNVQVAPFECRQRGLQHTEGVRTAVDALVRADDQPSPRRCDDAQWSFVHRWCRYVLNATQELPGRQHGSATAGRMRSDGLQQQRYKLADQAVAAQQRFGRVLVLGRPSEFTNRCHGMLDTLARQLAEDLAAQGLIRMDQVEYQQTDVTQQQRGDVQVTDGA